jgi:hypothetical protein
MPISGALEGYGMKTRQMCLELIDAVTVDEFERGKQERDIHIYYKFIDKGYTGKSDD